MGTENYALRAPGRERTGLGTLVGYLAKGGIEGFSIRLKLQQPRRPAMLILAVDIGKSKSVSCRFDSLEQAQQFQTVHTTPQAFRALFTAAPVERVVIEACDAAGWVCDLCQELNLPVQVANVNGEAWRWKNTKLKTDRADALKLARLSAAGDLGLVHVPLPAVRQWRALILYRHKLVKRRTAIRNAVHAILVSQGMARAGNKALWTLESLAQLRTLSRPVPECGPLDLWRGQLHEELESLDQLAVRTAAVEKKLDELGDAHEQVRRLQTIPGVGPRLLGAGGGGDRRPAPLRRRPAGQRLRRHGAAAVPVGADGPAGTHHPLGLPGAAPRAGAGGLGDAAAQHARAGGVRADQQRPEDAPQAGGGGAGKAGALLVVGDDA